MSERPTREQVAAAQTFVETWRGVPAGNAAGAEAKRHTETLAAEVRALREMSLDACEYETRERLEELEAELHVVREASELNRDELRQTREKVKPEPIHAVCPQCGGTHVDRDEWATNAKLHRSHLCEHCGHVWRPFEHYTIGVEVTSLADAEGIKAVSRAHFHIKVSSSVDVHHLRQLLDTAPSRLIEVEPEYGLRELYDAAEKLVRLCDESEAAGEWTAETDAAREELRAVLAKVKP